MFTQNVSCSTFTGFLAIQTCPCCQKVPRTRLRPSPGPNHDYDPPQSAPGLNILEEIRQTVHDKSSRLSLLIFIHLPSLAGKLHISHEDVCESLPRVCLWTSLESLDTTIPCLSRTTQNTCIFATVAVRNLRHLPQFSNNNNNNNNSRPAP